MKNRRYLQKNIPLQEKSTLAVSVKVLLKKVNSIKIALVFGIVSKHLRPAYFVLESEIKRFTILEIMTVEYRLKTFGNVLEWTTQVNLKRWREKMAIRRWTSNAEWPESSGVTDSYGKNESSDYHESEDAARIVCRMLERDGLGGENRVFPIMTWVEKKKI